MDLKTSGEVKVKLKKAKQKAKVIVKRRGVVNFVWFWGQMIFQRNKQRITCKLNRSQWARTQKLSETTKLIVMLLEESLLGGNGGHSLHLLLRCISFIEPGGSTSFLWFLVAGDQSVSLLLFQCFSVSTSSKFVFLIFVGIGKVPDSNGKSVFNNESMGIYMIRLHFAYFIHSSHWLFRHGWCLRGFGFSLL